MKSSIYKGKKILITGATGFIGSNLVDSLIKLGADITAVSRDEKTSMSGVKWVIGDIRDAQLMNKAVVEKDIIFNLAAQVSHMDKNIISYEDLDINCRGQITLLEACRMNNPKAKIVFSSTRMVYGENSRKPIKETDPTNPLTIYGIHKLTAEKYHLLYYKRYNIRSVILRIGNPYGDRQHLSNGLYSLPGFFMNQAMQGKAVEILSTGKQVRDYIYVKDLIEIMLRVAISEKTNGQVYNCGSGIKHTFGDMVNAIANTVDKGKFVYAKNPTDNSNQDSYCLDISKLVKDIKWKPNTKLETGVKLMHQYAKKYPNPNI